MKFSDHRIREPFDTVFVKRSESEMNAREESNSLVWDVEKYGVDFNLYSVPVRDIKIGENIYNQAGEFVCYRSE